jgi:signal transduction histidine kinase
MIGALLVAWVIGSLGILAVVIAARARRTALAREMHELRGSLTAARLAVDLMPVLDLDRPAVCKAASTELERSYYALGEFEDLLHAKLLPMPHVGPDQAASIRSRRQRIDARQELERLALIWAEAARRNGRGFSFSWEGPEHGVMANGPQRRFAEVMANLLANAIRHGGGDVRVVARMRSDSLRIEVSDDGPGLARPVATLARGRKLGPHGHGLAVAVRAARKLGGDVNSAPSVVGATLVFTVPAIHDPTAERHAVGAPIVVHPAGVTETE